MQGTLGRRNRSFEYDSVGDAYAAFSPKKILPYVCTRVRLKLSTNGNDRLPSRWQQRRHLRFQCRLGTPRFVHARLCLQRQFCRLFAAGTNTLP